MFFEILVSCLSAQEAKIMLHFAFSFVILGLYEFIIKLIEICASMHHIAS